MQRGSALRRGAGAVRLAVAVGALRAAVGCDAPGEEPKAERGYRRAEPVLGALARFRADRGLYPESLLRLVPEYLSAAALAIPDRRQERYPLGYRRVAEQCELSFRYAGPGMNECTYRSATAAWDCRGYF
jgi:hypothetical protein